MRSGKAVMNPCAASLIAIRPSEGVPPLMVSEPLGEKNAATLAASWLHHAAVYRVAKPRSSVIRSCAIKLLQSYAGTRVQFTDDAERTKVTGNPRRHEAPHA